MTSARESLVYPGRVSLSVRSSVMLMLARVYFSAAIKTEKRREIDTLIRRSVSNYLTGLGGNFIKSGLIRI